MKLIGGSLGLVDARTIFPEGFSIIMLYYCNILSEQLFYMIYITGLFINPLYSSGK